MTGYQLSITGDSSIGCIFKMKSKKIFLHVPTEEEKAEFIESCRDDKWIYSLTSEKYELKVLEVEIVE